jgi:hypothetical protein
MEEIDADCRNNLMNRREKTKMRSTTHTLFTGRRAHENSEDFM